MTRKSRDFGGNGSGIWGFFAVWVAFFEAVSLELGNERRAKIIIIDEMDKPLWTSIDYVKRHSRIDYDCEDAELEMYIVSAEQTILNLLGRTYEDVIENYGDVPAPIRHATLLLVDNSYQHRTPIEPVQLYAVNYSFDLMLKPYIRL